LKNDITNFVYNFQNLKGKSLILSEYSICILPVLKGPGGPSSFQSKLRKGLAAVGIPTHHNVRQPGTKALLVIGGTSRIGDLLYAAQKGIRIVQRLDGMNWLHRRQPTGLRHFLRSERMNFQLSFIRRFFADMVVYQSGFTRDWWNTSYGSLKKPSTVIHNGVDLDTFRPDGKSDLPKDFIRLLVVEGSFKGGHERDLFNAVEAASLISKKINGKVELMVVGNAPQEMRENVSFSHQASVRWMGLIPHEEIPALDRSAHLLFPAEINAACPNAVIEALASGLPVVSYATGSLPDLVGEEGGEVVPYGADYWKLEAPDTGPLADAAVRVLLRREKYRVSARASAERLFGLEKMVGEYKKVLLGE
jgi:glycosyltransferase involved in cell wall biosynthesis